MTTNATIIIGERSNLSRVLSDAINNAFVIPSTELQKLPEILSSECSANIIYNTFVKSSQLGLKESPEAYSKYTFEVLSEFTSNCLKYHQSINGVIYTSSSSVYGNNELAYESDKCEIRNLYASMKLASEFFLTEHFEKKNIRLIIARVFNMYGGYDEFSIISKIMNALINNSQITITNNGQAIRDFIHIEDVVSIYLDLLKSNFHGVMNVGTGNGTSVCELIEAAEKAFNLRLNTNNREAVEINKSIANIKILEKHFGIRSFKNIKQYYHEISNQKNMRSTFSA